MLMVIIVTYLAWELVSPDSKFLVAQQHSISSPESLPRTCTPGSPCAEVNLRVYALGKGLVELSNLEVFFHLILSSQLRSQGLLNCEGGYFLPISSAFC